jgi:hypothetical protein
MLLNGKDDKSSFLSRKEVRLIVSFLIQVHYKEQLVMVAT